MTSSGPLGNYLWGAQWSSFAVPAPVAVPGATINVIYPIIIASISTHEADSNLIAGLANVDGGINIFKISNPAAIDMDLPATPPVSATNQQYTSSGPASIGSTASVIENAQIGIRLAQSESIPSFHDTLTVSFVGLAIYYTAP